MTDQPYTWPQLIRDMIQAAQVIALAWIASLTSGTSGKVSSVQETQAAVKEDLAEKMKKEARANEVKLYEAWKNLDWLAQDSGKKADALKATEAKRVYDEFVANHNGQ